MIQVVVIGVVRHEGKYLLTKRVSPNPQINGKWQFAGGGLEQNETLEECLHRELREELGVEVKNERLVPRLVEVIREEAGWHGVFVSYLCELVDAGAEIVLDEEASDWKWLTPEEIIGNPSDFLSKTDEIVKEIEAGAGKRT